MELVGAYSNKTRTAQQFRELLLLVPRGRVANNRKARRQQNRLEPKDLQLFREDYQAGMKVEDLALRYRLSRDAVLDSARRLNLAKRYPKLMPKDVEVASAMYAGGQPVAALGHHFGVSPATMLLALRRAGVTIRPRRGYHQS